MAVEGHPRSLIWCQSKAISDLAYGDYHLFLNLKNFLRGVRYLNNECLKPMVEAWWKDGHKTPANFRPMR